MTLPDDSCMALSTGGPEMYPSPRKNLFQPKAIGMCSSPQMQITAAGLMLPIFCKNAPVMPDNVWSIQNSVINVAPLKHAEPKNAIEAWTIKGLFPSKSAK